MHFEFQGIPRLSAFGLTPNELAAFIAVSVTSVSVLTEFAFRCGESAWAAGNPVGFRRAASAAVLGVAIESALMYALVATYSRGGLLACLAAILLQLKTTRSGDGASRAVRSAGFRFRPGVRFAVRMGVLGLLVLGTRFHERISVGHVMADASVQNRFTVWSGALEMIASSPKSGWGIFNTGAEYSNWFQPLDRSETYRTLVNDFLQIGVGYGLLSLIIALFFMILASWGAVRSVNPRDKNGLLPNLFIKLAGNGIVVIAVCGLFSTILSIPGVARWIVMIGGLSILLQSYVDGTEIWKRTRWSAQIALIVSAAAYLTGFFLVRHEQFEYVVAPAYIQVTNKNAPHGEDWIWLVDYHVTGETPGKLIRQWMISEAVGRVFVVSPQYWLQATDAQLLERTISKLSSKATNLCVSGGFSDVSLPSISWARCVILCPSSAPTYFPGPNGRIVLGGCDELGLNQIWMEYGAQHHLVVQLIKDFGQDVSSARLQFSNSK